MQMRSGSPLLFTIATLAPVPLLALSILQGGAWIWAGFLYMGAMVIVLDQFSPVGKAGGHEDAEFPAADRLLVIIGLTHVLLMPLIVWALAEQTGLSLVEKGLLFLAAGYWMGQVVHPAAHELIHRGQRGLYRLGVAIYVSLLIGHHASAHRLVHHRFVATPEDPSSAPAGMGFWSYAPRAWAQSFRAGWVAESALRSRGEARGMHPFAVYLGGAGLALAVAAFLAGWTGVLVWLGLAAHAQLQMALADYVQHYGLRRAQGPDGRYEPVSERHSWNAPHWFSSALMLNAPRHSDHHAHPTRPYPALRLPNGAPMLPWPLPLACAVAMVPRLWKRRMKAELARLQAG